MADGPCKMEGLSIFVGLTGEGLASEALTNRDLPLAELSSRSALNPCILQHKNPRRSHQAQCLFGA